MKKLNFPVCLLNKISEENLIAVIGDLFLGGAETTATSISWLLLYLALNPDKQQKFQEEIDSVLEGRLPVLSDRDM